MAINPGTMLLCWIALGSAISGLASLYLGAVSYGIAAFLSATVLCLTLIYQSLRSSDSVVTSADYFGAQSLLSSVSTIQSLGAAWIMLGNVVVANMILGQSVGLLMIWVIVTWAWAFVLMSHRVRRIRSSLQPTDTLHSFLHNSYQSRRMRLVAATVTVFVGIGVFSVEVLAGTALLTAMLPEQQAAVVGPALTLIVVVAMCVAAMTGGLKSIVLSDSTFWYLIVLSTFVFLCLVILTFGYQTAGPSIAQLPWIPTSLKTMDILAFCIGIFALQVPLLLGDFGTWQRIKATRLSEEEKLAEQIFFMGGKQAFLWGVPVVAGIVVTAFPTLDAGRTGDFYEAAAPLIELIRNWQATASIPMFVRVIALTFFVAGMLAVMISTANTYLMVALEAYVHDFNEIPSSPDYKVGSDLPMDVRSARGLAVLFALLACLPVLAFVFYKINLVSIVFIVFGAQVALAPAAILALYFKDHARELASTAIRGTLTGFACSIAFGTFATLGLLGEWWKSFGVYLAPTIALGLPAAMFVTALARRDRTLTSSKSYLWNLFVPKAESSKSSVEVRG